MKKTIVLGAALMSALAIGVAPPVPAEAQQNVIILRVCNNTRDTAQVAISYQPVNSGSFYNEGWYNVTPGQCRDLARTTNSYMYGYAEVLNSDDDVWQGDHPLCVAYPGPYDFWDNGSAYCESWQEVRNFVTLRANNWGVFTWNLNY